MAEIRRRLMLPTANFIRPLCRLTLTAFFPSVYSPRLEPSSEVAVPEAVAAPAKTSEAPTLQWLALALTPGLGPTKGRRLVELLGGVQNIFKASLTELEAIGIQAVSAQSLGTGRSMELAHDELARTVTAGAGGLFFLEPSFPPPPHQNFDPPPFVFAHARDKRCIPPANPAGGDPPPP